MHLKYAITIIFAGAITLLLRLAFLDILKHFLWLTKVNILVEPTYLQLFDLIFGLTHNVCYTLCALDV